MGDDMAPRADMLALVDRATLTEPVRRTLGSETAEIAEWQGERIAFAHFNPTSEGLYRLWGTAHDPRQPGVMWPWSLVLKVAHPPEDEGMFADVAHTPDQWNYWKREFLALRSGLLGTLPGELAAPRCYGASERNDGSVWLWLEQIEDSYGPQWQLAQYAVAARQLGQLNGAYLADQPFPQEPWLSRDFLRGWVESFGAAIPELSESLSSPLAQRGFPGASAARLTRLWNEREQLFAGLARLPQAFGHLDAHRNNLFVRRLPDGRDQAVAIDWAFAGREALGVDLAALVSMSVMYTGEVESLPDLDRAAFTSYLAGLADAGWQVGERQTRFGYAASTALRTGALLSRYCPIANWDGVEEFSQRQFHCSAEELMDRVAAVLAYTLDRADEGRALLPGVLG